MSVNTLTRKLFHSDPGEHAATGRISVSAGTLRSNFRVGLLEIAHEERGIKQRTTFTLVFQLAPQFAQSCRCRRESQHQILVGIEGRRNQLRQTGIYQETARYARCESFPGAMPVSLS